VNTNTDHVTSLIFGRWRSQILYSAAELRIFDRLDESRHRSAAEVAEEAVLDSSLLYRLMRALGAMGLVEESADKRFRLTPSGGLLQSRAEGSLLYMALLEEGPEHYALWKHLPEMVRDGRQNAFPREYGKPAFEYASENERYASIFNQAMSSFSGVQTGLAVEALRKFDLSNVRTWCDVGGGQGHMLCSLLQQNSHLQGIVLDLPSVVSQQERGWASKLGVANRCQYVGGDMFADVPPADAYSLKMILHDWSDEECVRILRNLRRRVSGPGRVFIVEHIVPSAADPHFSKLYDIHMMCWGSGRERTEAEYAGLLEASGWKPITILYPQRPLMGVVVGGCAELND
jgi:DNA-binding MarR family transcriptional regulator